ncbi:pilus assembly PilX family protein [Colwellia sp. TT2012]|uniref:pilus assembly PilX family protein n=1 Tax=Colwellia sp. TT2012 TaxID=1720342 RepID=UPI00070D38F6|nr:pilus assembly PilX N-terminal domain-containing protein [Colwellia sp. TT2012]
MVIKNKGFLRHNTLPIRGLSKVILSPLPVKQQGVVLIVALVFLVALTGVAAALMQNTTSDMKMAGASNEKVVAMQAAISAVDEVIDNQLNQQAVNLFARGLDAFAGYNNGQLLPAATATGATANTVLINNLTFDEYSCPRSSVASSVGIIECNYLQLQIQRPYGRNNTSIIVVNANIVQQLLSNN